MFVFIKIFFNARIASEEIVIDNCIDNILIVIKIKIFEVLQIKNIIVLIKNSE